MVRQPAPTRALNRLRLPPEPTPEERRIAAAYQREQEAMSHQRAFARVAGFASGIVFEQQVRIFEWR